ncbi:MAG: 2,3-bisphosphoglycerate-independent phosphoglycerate mutase [Epsilonproteobacteria bacterium]|nr:2,3-bisphosphoglycerate-independent phosphoglycerate mutase [Campylobacterota bacterium]
MSKPTLLVILDGFGWRSQEYGNAIAHANMPFFSHALTYYPSTLLHASQGHVGLLEGQIGNSEVGHLTIGAGRVIASSLKHFHDFIRSGKLFEHELLTRKLQELKQTGKALHLMGLLSDAGVHSHQYHLHNLLQLAKQIGVKHVYVHAFLDGRDSPPQSAEAYLKRLEQVMNDFSCGRLASIHGRFYAMDRDNNWQRTKECFDVLVGKKQTRTTSWQNILRESYEQNIFDEFIEPVRLLDDGVINAGDGIIFFNLRPDRARQLTRPFLDPYFAEFDRDQASVAEQLAFFVTPVRYDESFKKFNNDVLFERELIADTLLDCLAAQRKTIFTIAETEKYAHVTYFFRGMREVVFENEQQVLIPSIKTKNYADQPAMSAQEITDAVLSSLARAAADFYLINYANADMVGHSGNLQATVQACQVLDQQLARLYEHAVQGLGGTLFITADHGNAEQMLDREGSCITAHTINPVPFVAIGDDLVCASQVEQPLSQPPCFGLSAVAPAILRHMDIAVPSQMTKQGIIL